MPTCEIAYKCILCYWIWPNEFVNVTILSNCTRLTNPLISEKAFVMNGCRSMIKQCSPILEYLFALIITISIRWTLYGHSIFDGQVYQQKVGLPMGTNLFLYLYEAGFIMKLRKKINLWLWSLISLNNDEFGRCVNMIYQSSLKQNIKKLRYYTLDRWSELCCKYLFVNTTQ